MYLKSPKGSKRFSSSLTGDVVIAFRMTAKLFSLRKKSQNETTMLGLFPDLITPSLLGATGLLFTYHDKLNIVVKVHLTPKIVFRLIESTCYSKHFGTKIFEFA